MRRDILDKEHRIKELVNRLESKASICRELKCKPLTLDSYLKKLGILYRGNMPGRGRPSPSRRPSSYYMEKDGPYINSHTLKEKMITDGIRARECQGCNRSVWMDLPIPLELHHENGDRQDNRDENLKILCPNCHALSGNNSGRANVRR